MNKRDYVDNCHFGKSFFVVVTEPSLFVDYSSHAPQELLEFCGFMQLSAVSFFLCVFRCPMVCCISVGNSLVYTCLFLREVIVWSVFPV